LNAAHRALVTDYVCSQLNLTLRAHNQEVREWMLRRSQVYDRSGEVGEDSNIRAAVDLVAWQRQCAPCAIWEFLEGLAEVRRSNQAATNNETKPT
jgi:hypothetical protein